ncbi:hypothetical protein CKAH01_07328 [Colletotrichum kahawae]|uniref:Uncharacterized protein n=1 Tax=Colletotrichum kahawae TaxID=34407 RepID=A0AAD9Y6D2_COLKA|nr:hypothetical protein CKAH01_07328 [Colletotrichum kahawae]
MSYPDDGFRDNIVGSQRGERYDGSLDCHSRLLDSAWGETEVGPRCRAGPGALDIRPKHSRCQATINLFKSLTWVCLPWSDNVRATWGGVGGRGPAARL